MPYRMIQGLMIFVFLAVLAGCATKSGPLAVLPISSPTAAQHNLEGIQLYNDGKWQEAKSRFESATRADSTLPEAFFNLALTEHKLGLHEQAKKHFTMAGEIAPKNKAIVESSLYRDHLGLSSIVFLLSAPLTSVLSPQKGARRYGEAFISHYTNVSTRRNTLSSGSTKNGSYRIYGSSI